jgi:hypothetical protein
MAAQTQTGGLASVLSNHENMITGLNCKRHSGKEEACENSKERKLRKRSGVESVCGLNTTPVDHLVQIP